MPYKIAKRDTIVWKKAKSEPYGCGKSVILRCLLRKGTRYYTTGEENAKLRTAHLLVLGVQRLRLAKIDGEEVPVQINLSTTKAYGMFYNQNYTYTVGKVAKPTKRFDTHKNIGLCGSGIHCFFSRSAAVKY